MIEERIKAAKSRRCAMVRRGEQIRSGCGLKPTRPSAGNAVQATVDETLPPMPFNQIQCADLKGWDGSNQRDGWRKLEQSVAAL